MSLGVRDLMELPDSAGAMCELAEQFIRDWVPSVELGDDTLDRELADAEHRTHGAVPTALRWLYRRLGVKGSRLFRQDPIIHIGVLRADDGVVTFRIEQQGCAEWGYLADAGDDPAVVMKLAGSHHWVPFQAKLSVSVLEGVLSEAMWHCETMANVGPAPKSIRALEQLPRLGIPPFPFWWGVLMILDRASRLRGSVHARATPEVQPAVQG